MWSQWSARHSQCSAIPPSLSLLLGSRLGMTKYIQQLPPCLSLVEITFFFFFNLCSCWTEISEHMEIQRVVLGVMCSFIQLVWMVRYDLTQLELPFLGFQLNFRFLYFCGDLTRVLQKGLSPLKQLEQRICNLLPASPCCTFPLFAFIPVIESNQISINCQVLRELG